jgi:hypothetical protein
MEGHSIKTNKLTLIFYIIGILMTIIPILITILSGIGFSEFLSKLFIRTSITLFLLGKLLTVIKNKKYKKRISLEDTLILIFLLIFLIKG